MSEKIALAAEKIASDDIIMNSYKDFYRGKGYFLTKNEKIFGAKRKPPKFPATSVGFAKKWMNSEWFVLAQRKYLLFLAGLSENHIVKDSNFEKLKRAYEKWSLGYLVVFYGVDAKWTCNLFVGEALFESGYQDIMSGGKYLSAKQIWEGVKLRLVDKNDVQRGDIAAFGGTHVEIVTEVRRNQLFEEDEFCSRGTGRGFMAMMDGKEKCDASSWFGSREINDENIKFFKP